MYGTAIILCALCSVVLCANYQRYGDTTDRYNSYASTIATLYDQNPYKIQSFNNDVASVPVEATRYPNYNPSYSTSRYGSAYSTSGYGSNSYNGAGYSNTGLNGGLTNGQYGSNGGLYGNQYNSNGGSGLYNAPKYGESYSTQNYGSSYGYSTPRYGAGYDSNYLSSSGQGYTSYERPLLGSMGEYCQNRSPQNGIWVDNLMGMWYGVEHIYHLGGYSRMDYARSCIVIHIAEPAPQPSSENPVYHVQHINSKFRQEFRHLRLLWDEDGQTIEYALYFRNDSAGHWRVVDAQNGTLAFLPKYQQFTGTIQVLKAVNDHLVLNFCQEPSGDRPAQLYSVLFSRDPGTLARWEVDSVHNMLQNKQLSVASRRMVCGNSADRAVVSVVFSILTCALACLLAKA